MHFSESTTSLPFIYSLGLIFVALPSRRQVPVKQDGKTENEPTAFALDSLRKSPVIIEKSVEKRNKETAPVQGARLSIQSS